MKKSTERRVRLVRKRNVGKFGGKWYYEATFRVEVDYGCYYMNGATGRGNTEEAARADAKRIAYGAAWERWQRAIKERVID